VFGIPQAHLLAVPLANADRIESDDVEVTFALVALSDIDRGCRRFARWLSLEASKIEMIDRIAERRFC
jgi:hypothetical protein